MAHLLHYPTATRFACAVLAVGQRSPGTQCDPANTTCPRCLAWIANNPDWDPVMDSRPRNSWGTLISDIDADEYCPQCEQDNRLGHFSACPLRGLQ